MKILYINALYSPELIGGAERVLQAQAEGLAARGHVVAVLTIGPDPGLTSGQLNGVQVWRAGIRNFYFHYHELQQRRVGALGHFFWHLADSYNPLMAEYAMRVAQQFQPDVAACHNLSGWSISVWDALAALSIPIVQVLHDQYLICAKSQMYRAGRLCRRQCLRCKLLRLPHRARTRRVDTLVGVSRFICQRHLAHGYFQRVRSIKVIPNARDTAGETIPATPREDDGLTVYGYIGRLSPSKGVELLLETFSRNCRDSWRLLLAGTGEADYEKHLRQRFAHPQIEFLGQIKAENFYPRLDCTVAPSLWEDTFPSVVFESLLYGRPVLGSDLGGIPEMINPGNGRFFAGGDSADLCRALMEMAAAKPAFRDRFYAIQHGAARYCDTEGWLNIWEETFREAVEAQRERKMS